MEGQNKLFPVVFNDCATTFKKDGLAVLGELVLIEIFLIKGRESRLSFEGMDLAISAYTRCRVPQQ